MPPQQPSSATPDFIPAAPDFIPDQPGLTPTGTNKAGFPIYQGTPQPTPGFISRSAEALGIPTSMDDLKAMFTPQPADLLGPGGRVAQTIIQGMTQPMTPQEKADMAAPQTLHGGPIGEIANQVAKRTLEGPLAPVGGQAVSNIANDKGNIPAQAGDVAGTIGNLLLLHSAKDPRTAARIAYATGADAKDVLRAEGDLKNAVLQNGVPKNLPELNDRIEKAKSTLNTEYANALGPYATQQTMPSAISQRILKLITPNLDMTQPGRVLKKQIQSAALEFQKPWTLAQLDQERMDANARLHAFNNKDAVDQYAATRGNNRNPAIDNAIANGVRETVYPQLDRLTGQPAGYHADLKDRIGALLNLSNESQKTLDKLNTKSLSSEGAPLLERMGIRPRGIIGERPRLFLSEIGKSNPLETVNSRVAGAFPGAGTSAARAAALVSALRKVAPNHPLVQPEQ